MDDPEKHNRIRAEMGRPSSTIKTRGRKDTVGFGPHDADMAALWATAITPPAPDSLGPLPPPGAKVRAVIAPHDDYMYAGRVYRRILPMLTARTVILIGVLHQWRRFDLRDRLVFDSYTRWSSAAGVAPVSDAREQLLSRLPGAHVVQSSMVHDSEHSIEALLPWIHHVHPELEIVPVLVATSGFARLEAMAAAFAFALGEILDQRGWELGRDVGIAISADAIHYGADFRQTRFGARGPWAYNAACVHDLGLLVGPLAGEVTRAKIRAAYETWVDPARPANYRWTWCGRFSIPFGLLLLEQLGGAHGWPITYATSVSAPRLALERLGFGVTAPANDRHFVGYPAVAYTAPGLVAEGPDV